jgi:hypothetical protein
LLSLDFEALGRSALFYGYGYLELDLLTKSERRLVIAKETKLFERHLPNSLEQCEPPAAFKSEFEVIRPVPVLND